jgi:predicted HTH domain antitoxin
MAVQQITINLPLGILNLVAKKEIEKEFKRFLALKCYTEETLTLGQAANLAGMERIEFETYLSENHIPISLLEYDEIKADLEKIRQVRASKK